MKRTNNIATERDLTREEIEGSAKYFARLYAVEVPKENSDLKVPHRLRRSRRTKQDCNCCRNLTTKIQQIMIK